MGTRSPGIILWTMSKVAIPQSGCCRVGVRGSSKGPVCSQCCGDYEWSCRGASSTAHHHQPSHTLSSRNANSAILLSPVVRILTLSYLFQQISAVTSSVTLTRLTVFLCHQSSRLGSSIKTKCCSLASASVPISLPPATLHIAQHGLDESWILWTPRRVPTLKDLL